MTHTDHITEIPFDTPIDRHGTHSVKYDALEARFGRADILPLWVADMDFAAPACVRQAMADRLAHPVYGYSLPSQSLHDQLRGWYRRRHGWHIDPATLMLAPGVVPTLFACVQALTEPGDGVLVPTPVYPPFFAAVDKNHRHIVTSPLQPSGQGRTLDFDRLETQAADTRLLMLCSPHNPVGRVWTADELTRLIDLALRHDLTIISDDIHCDLTFPGETHIPLATLAPPELHLLTAISPSKTFNIPGLNLSALVASHEADADAMRRVFEQWHVNPNNPFTLAAFEAAYAHGDAWVDDLRAYLADNRRLVMDRLDSLPVIDCMPPQATALMWLDCRAMQLDDAALRRFFIDRAGLGLNDGIDYGTAGSGFMRLNIGTQRQVLEQTMSRLEQAVRATS